jgi:hypothetical protein
MGSIFHPTAEIPAGIITSSDGTGMIDDSMVIRINISRYPILPKYDMRESIKACILVAYK